MSAATMTAWLKPGVHHDINEAWYHALPGLSYSGAKVLLDCPARYRYERDHPRTPTRDMVIGTCVHTEVLGAGQPFEVVPGDRRTKAVRERVAEVEATGALALSEAEGAAVAGMVNALRSHDGVKKILRRGQTEVSLLWADPETNVQLRARVDWLRPDALFDLKTTDKVSPAALRRKIYDFRYDIQDVAYREGAAACDLGNLPFGFVFVERTPPHLVTIAQLGERWHEPAAADWHNAIRMFDAYTIADNWPSYSDNIITIDPPAWAN